MENAYLSMQDTNGIYQYRCFIKDQMKMWEKPKAFLRVDSFTVRTDLLTKATSEITVIEVASNINNGDVLVLYDPTGETLYTGVITSIDEKKISCSQIQSFFKGTWIYTQGNDTSRSDGYLERELRNVFLYYIRGYLIPYDTNWQDPVVRTRMGGRNDDLGTYTMDVNYVNSTLALLPSDVDENGNENYTVKDMEDWIYECYQTYGVIFKTTINYEGNNSVDILVPNYTPLKVGSNMFAIKDMNPIEKVEETNRLVIYAQDKTYRTTYVARTNDTIVEQPASTANRFNIVNTKVVFSDDPVNDLIASNLPSTMYNHKLTFSLLLKNHIYQAGDFNLGGQLDIYHGNDYYNSVLTGYEISKQSNQNITEIKMTCGMVRNKLTQMLTMGKV